MGARNKLNTASLNGAVLLAGIAGLVTSSWAVFALTFAILIAGALASGDIRPSPTRRPNKR